METSRYALNLAPGCISSGSALTATASLESRVCPGLWRPTCAVQTAFRPRGAIARSPTRCRATIWPTHFAVMLCPADDVKPKEPLFPFFRGLLFLEPLVFFFILFFLAAKVGSLK